jgi:hypothetical protein
VRSDERLRLIDREHVHTAAFLADCGFRGRRSDRFEHSLRRRHFVRRAAFWLSAVAAAWIAMESARALALF